MWLERARQELHRRDVTPFTVIGLDVDDNADHRERWGALIPVILDGDVCVCAGAACTREVVFRHFLQADSLAETSPELGSPRRLI